MPVDFEEYFPEDGRIDLTEGTNARTLLSFLLENPGVGFTPAKLHGQTGIPRGSVNSTLTRLERAGLARHKGDYWAAEDEDRIAAATAFVLGLAAIAGMYDDDWYARNEGWSDHLENLCDEGALSHVLSTRRRRHRTGYVWLRGRPAVPDRLERHPSIHGDEYVVTVVTTTEWDRAVPLSEDSFTRGSRPRRLFVSPWNPVTLKDQLIEKHVTSIAGNVVDEVVTELLTYVEADRDPTNCWPFIHASRFFELS